MRSLSQIGNIKNEYDFSHLLYYGNYACVNFLEKYKLQNKVLSNNEYPELWKTEFGISDTHLFHRMMIDEGYLEKTPMNISLQTHSLEEIQEFAKQMDLSPSGTKEEILQRLDLNVSLEDMQKHFSVEETYSLSMKGKTFIANHEDLLKLYHAKNRYHVDYNEYAAIQSTNKDEDYYTILWKVMTKRFQTHATNTEYDLVQKEYLNMYRLFIDQDRKNDALVALLNYLFMELNVFPETFIYIEKFNRSSMTVPDFLAEETVPICKVRIDIMDDILQLKEFYNPKTAQGISDSNISYYINSERFLEILQQLFDKTLLIPELEEQINTRIPKALDVILRQQPSVSNQK